jgi:radical SAM protein (TIGR01212 family)
MTIYHYRDFLKKRYGRVLYRVPIDAGFTCPHRNACGAGGCTFCSDTGARAVQLGDLTDIREQVRAGVGFARQRYGANGFMAYLQAFTATFASTGALNDVVDLVCSEEKFEAMLFGTRPDCLPDRVITYLRELSRKIDVWVELGVQTIHDRTLRRINRGHDYQASCDAIMRLHEAGIPVAVHLIIGLPGETMEDFHQTVRAISALPVSALKLHNLHVLHGTALEKEYLRQPFHLFNEHEYCEVLLRLLPIIPADIPLLRLTTDSPEDSLVAPRWNMSKGRFLDHLEKMMRNRRISQGMHLNERKAKNSGPPPSSSLEPVRTDDGSLTLWNGTVKEHYHSQAGARSEAEHKYCLPGKLDKRLGGGKLRILDVCFGLGYNSLVSCEHALEAGAELEITALEIDRRPVEMAAAHLREPDRFFNWNSCLRDILEGGVWTCGDCTIALVWGDARHSVTGLAGPFDLIWLDAFSTQRNSELWSVDFFAKLLPLLSPTGVLCTYCAAIPVRAGLLEAGFVIGETEPFGRRRGGTMAARDTLEISRPLPERDLHLIASLRGVPYRDPHGTATNREILRSREAEITACKMREQSG